MLELLASWGEFLGGVAVVISLIYVGLQVRASVKQSQLDSYTKFAELFTNWTSSIYASADTTQAFASGVGAYNSLNEEDKVRFNLMMAMYYGIVDTVMAHEAKGIYQYPEAYKRHLQMALDYYRMPGVRQWWEQGGRDLPYPHIVEYLENLPEE